MSLRPYQPIRSGASAPRDPRLMLEVLHAIDLRRPL
jgi:hypothetical protein